MTSSQKNRDYRLHGILNLLAKYDKVVPTEVRKLNFRVKEVGVIEEKVYSTYIDDRKTLFVLTDKKHLYVSTRFGRSWPRDKSWSLMKQELMVAPQLETFIKGCVEVGAVSAEAADQFIGDVREVIALDKLREDALLFEDAAKAFGLTLNKTQLARLEKVQNGKALHESQVKFIRQDDDFEFDYHQDAIGDPW